MAIQSLSVDETSALKTEIVDWAKFRVVIATDGETMWLTDLVTMTSAAVAARYNEIMDDRANAHW